MGVLKIESKLEDVPRVITASGRGPEPGSKFDLVIKPREGEAALVVYLKPPRAKRGEPKPTPEAWIWMVVKDDSFDSPGKPHAHVSPKRGLATYRRILKGKGRQGPVTFKGRWSGRISWGPKGPVIELRRRVASYVTVTVRSVPEIGWDYTVQRNTSKWWVDGDGTVTGSQARLVDAIEAAYGEVASVTGPACAVKDTTRRQARDSAYAAERPISMPAATRLHSGKEWGAGSWRKLSEPVPPSDALMGVNEGTVPVKLAPALRALDTDGQAGRFGVLTRDVGGVARGAFVWISNDDGAWFKSSKRATYMLPKPATRKRRASSTSSSKPKKAPARKPATSKPTPKKAPAKTAPAKKGTSGCGGCTGGPHACSQCSKKPAKKAAPAKKATPVKKRALKPKATTNKDAAIGDAIAAASQQALFAMLGNPQG